MKRSHGFGLVALVLLAGLGAWFWSMPAAPTAAPDPAAPVAAEAAKAEVVSLLLSRPVVQPRGKLKIEGRVVGPAGPVAQATVVATTPELDDALSERMCGCLDCQLKLLACGCEHAVDKLGELVAQREGDAQPMARAQTDADGRYVLEGLEDGTFTVWADAARLGSAVLPAVKAGEPKADLLLAPGVALAGSVKGKDGKALTEARVTAVLTQHARTFEVGVGPDGTFAFASLPAGDYVVMGAAPGFLPAQAKVKPGAPAALVLDAPTQVAGTVRSAGKPAAAATVTLRSPHRSRELKADAAGRFHFEQLHPGTYTLLATDGRQMAQLELDLPAATEPVLELGPAGFIDVTVTDAHGPVADAKAWLQKGELTAKSDAAGLAHLGPLAPGTYKVAVSAKAHRSGAESSVEVTADRATPLKVTLENAALVTGVVVDEAGKPLKEITVRASSRGENRFQNYGAAASEEDGTFTVDGLQPGQVTLSVEDQAYLALSVDATAPSSGVRLTLQAGLTASGKVVDADGKAVPEANLMAVLDTQDRQHLAMRSAHSDGEGHFALKGLPPGKYNVSFSRGTGLAAGQEQQTAHSTFDLDASRSDLVLRFEAGEALSGTVADQDGAPVPGAMVMAMKDAAKGVPRSESSVATTGPDGHFAFAHLPPGTYSIGTSHEGYDAPEPLTHVSPGQADVALVLTQRAAVHGRVVRADHTPLTRFRVEVEDVKSETGEFTVHPRQRAEAMLHFSATGFAELAVPYERKGEAQVELGDVVMTEGRTVKGKVVDGAGAAVAGAFVGADPTVNHGRTFVADEPVVTAADGTFTLTHQALGELEVGAYQKGYGPSRAKVAAGQDRVELVLQAAATLTGHVRDAKGAAVRGRIQVDLGATDFDPEADVGADGSYTLTDLSAGHALLNLTLHGSSLEANAGFGPKTVELAAGKTTVVDFIEQAGAALQVTATGAGAQALVSLVKGTVALPTNPAEMLSLWGRSQGGEPENGQFTFHGLTDGPYTVVLFEQMGAAGFKVAVLPVAVAGKDVAVAIAMPANAPVLGLRR